VILFDIKNFQAAGGQKLCQHISGIFFKNTNEEKNAAKHLKNPARDS
jgi:hypothetical protein